MNSPIRIVSQQQTPKGLRLHIGLFGRRNVGKSSLINTLTHQSLSIVSDIAGTTTDPVEKACEFAPLGPVVFIDTAGIDDVGELGQMRIDKTMALLPWVDLALIVCSERWGECEEHLVALATQYKTPAIVVFNKIETAAPETNIIETLEKRGFTTVTTSATTDSEQKRLREAIASKLQSSHEPDPPMFEDILHTGDHVILVTPIDTGAPKGRLILPQVQAIREILDSDAYCTVVREDRLADVLATMKTPPRFVLTDSQVVGRVVGIVPDCIPVTTFSIQMATSKCDIVEMARGAASLAFLKPGDRIMVCETCSHHPQADDIGRKKIPRWISQKIGGELQVDVVVGKDFPIDLTPYKIILQCGGCVVTRRHMLARLHAAQQQNVPMTNYGVAISYLQGVLRRALALHPKALEAFETKTRELQH